MFIDVARVEIQSGNGGSGHVSFRREKFVPKGGPDGGNGGKGGDVVARASVHLNTLLDFRYKKKYAAEDGKPGGNSRKTGKNGKKLVIKVPLGTVIKDVDTGRVLADLQEADKDFLLARGGDGGRGNSEFKSPTNQTPRNAEPGYPGVTLNVELEMKMLADVGLVGFPNVGKSTLISVLSAAKPKIADYPFTTLVPNLGMVRIADEQSYCIADIPGLIEGAADGKGLGTQFLRHVERTRVLVFLLDCVANEKQPEEQYAILCNELEKHNPHLAARRRIICFSKADALASQEERDDILARFPKQDEQVPVLFLSSIAHENVDELKHTIWHIVQEVGDDDLPIEHKILPLPERISRKKKDNLDDDIYDEDEEYWDDLDEDLDYELDPDDEDYSDEEE